MRAEFGNFLDMRAKRKQVRVKVEKYTVNQFNE